MYFFNLKRDTIPVLGGRNRKKLSPILELTLGTTVPASLHAIVRMMIEGPNIEHQSHGNTTKDHITVILSELLQFNAVKS